jgi:hypothetical protein
MIEDIAENNISYSAEILDESEDDNGMYNS